MEIISYKKMSGNVYKITLDNKDEYKLYDDIILKYELLIDKRLDDNKLKRILEENGELEAFFKAIKYIGVKMRTELELRKYLKKYDFSSTVINRTIEKIRKMGYLDEQKYVGAFVSDALNLGMNGPKKIKDQLLKLGIDSKYVDEALAQQDHEIWLEKIKKIVEKKSKLNKVGETLFKNKMYSYLIMNGYYSEDIKDVLEEYRLDDSSNFIKEATKIYDKLSKKYVGSELNLKFKSKMYSKGYTVEDINNFLSQK